jgi:hypothetical protein
MMAIATIAIATMAKILFFSIWALPLLIFVRITIFRFSNTMLISISGKNSKSIQHQSQLAR